MLIKLVFLLMTTLTVTFQSSVDSVNIISEELRYLKINNPISQDQIIRMINRLDNLALTNSDNKAIKKVVAQILTEHAKNIFYSHYGKNSSLQKAYYFFKLASELGSSESLYYLSFFSFYKLDGKFLLDENFDQLPDKGKHAYLKNYIDKMNSSNLITNLYFSSIQGYNTSTYLLGNLHYFGKGTKKSCSSSSLYLKELAELFYVKDEMNEFYSPELVERKRLDSEYFFNDDKETSIYYQDSPEEIEYASMSAKLGNIAYLNQLATIHFYGLRGEKRDFSEALRYFYLAAQAGDNSAKANIGVMLIKGMGTEKNVEKGLAYLKEAQMKSDPRALTMLGKMYYTGNGVEKDAKKGFDYMREAVSLNYTDAYYNYALALLDQGDDKNKELAQSYLNSAAYQGHTQAMIHLGMLYLEGSDYYNCDLGNALIRTALGRGPWSRKSREAYHSYLKKDYRKATILYMESAMLNFEVASVNAALLIMNHNVFENKDLDILSVIDDIENDPVLLSLKNSRNIILNDNNSREMIVRDLKSILRIQKLSELETENTLNFILNFQEEYLKKYKGIVLKDLLEIGNLQLDLLSTLVLADAYQKGDIVKQNYTEAYSQYASIINSPTASLNPYMVSLAYYYIAEMNHYGLGREINLTKAITFYNKSLETSKDNFYLVYVKFKIAQYKKIYFETFGEFEGDLSLLELIKARLVKFESENYLTIILVFICLAALVVYFMKLRLSNYMDLYLKDVNI